VLCEPEFCEPVFCEFALGVWLPEDWAAITATPVDRHPQHKASAASIRGPAHRFHRIPFSALVLRFTNTVPFLSAIAEP
jgi:hypothetical protein